MSVNVKHMSALGTIERICAILYIDFRVWCFTYMKDFADTLGCLETFFSGQGAVGYNQGCCSACYHLSGLTTSSHDFCASGVCLHMK